MHLFPLRRDCWDISDDLFRAKNLLASAFLAALACAHSSASDRGIGFRLDGAEKLPSLAERGFSAEPSFQDSFDGAWEPGDRWRIASWKQNAALMGPARCRVNGFGQMVQTVKAGHPFLGGSMQTPREFGWGRWVARVKPTKEPGALNSIFTKDWDDLAKPGSKAAGNMGEVDIEFLSSRFGPNRGEVHLAIHLKNKDNAYAADIPLDFNPGDAFHEWGFDILPDRVVWHVDGKILHEWLYAGTDRIDPGYEVFFNSWTDTKWIDGPPLRDAEYLIDWVKFYPRP